MASTYTYTSSQLTLMNESITAATSDYNDGDYADANAALVQYYQAQVTGDPSSNRGYAQAAIDVIDNVGGGAVANANVESAVGATTFTEQYKTNLSLQLATTDNNLIQGPDGDDEMPTLAQVADEHLEVFSESSFDIPITSWGGTPFEAVGDNYVSAAGYTANPAELAQIQSTNFSNMSITDVSASYNNLLNAGLSSFGNLDVSISTAASGYFNLAGLAADIFSQYGTQAVSLQNLDPLGFIENSDGSYGIAQANSSTGTTTTVDYNSSGVATGSSTTSGTSLPSSYLGIDVQPITNDPTESSIQLLNYDGGTESISLPTEDILGAQIVGPDATLSTSSANAFLLGLGDSTINNSGSGTNILELGSGTTASMDGSTSSASIYGYDVNLQLGENGAYALNNGGVASIFGNNDNVTGSNTTLNIGAGVTDTTFNDGDYNYNNLSNTINMLGGTLNVNANNDVGGYDDINMNGASGTLNLNTPNGGFEEDVNIAPDATVSLNGSMNATPGAGDTLNVGAGYSQGLGDPAFGSSAASDVTYNMLGNAAYAAEIWAGANNVVNANATWSGDVQAFNGTSTLNLVNNDPNAVSSETQGGLLDIYGENENLTLHEGNVVLEDQNTISENDGSSVQTMAAGSVVDLPAGADRDYVDGYDSTVNIGGSSLYLMGSGNLVTGSNETSSSSNPQYIWDEATTNVLDVSNAHIQVYGYLTAQIVGSNDVITGATHDSFSITGANDDVSSSYSNVAFAGGYGGDDVLGGNDTGSNWSAPDPDDTPGAGGYGGYSSTAAISKRNGADMGVDDVAQFDKDTQKKNPSIDAAFSSEVSMSASALAAWLKASPMNTSSGESSAASSTSSQTKASVARGQESNAPVEGRLTPATLTSQAEVAAGLSQFDLLTHAMGIFDSNEGLVDLPFNEKAMFIEQQSPLLAGLQHSHSLA